ncbi:MAG: MBL fold metallo-hydrolase [bacterium]|nr:MBL fold metallo-hydrolase [bacterium]
MKKLCGLLVGLAMVLTAAGAAAETVAGLPVHVQKLGEGIVRVWVGDHISSTATTAFATQKGILVVDTTGIPVVDRALRGVIARELGRDDFTTLVNTHEHGDHTGGNAVYADCEIVGHELVAAGMNEALADRDRVLQWYATGIPEAEARLAALPADDPSLPSLREDLALDRLNRDVLLSGEHAPPPTRTFADRLTLDMGDTTFELYYTGGMHTASDIAVFVPRHGILMTGDTMSDRWLTDTPGCLASFIARPGVRHDFPKLLKNWEYLAQQKDRIRLLVTGHWNGELSYDGFAARVGYVRALWDGVQAEVARGATLESLFATFALDARFPELAQSPGFNRNNHAMTLMELWTVTTGQTSAADRLFALIDEGAGEAAVREVVASRGAEPARYFFMEGQLNAYGYRFLQAGRAPQAVAMFRAYADLFPESWNAYDSLGEGLLAVGDTDGAVAMYEKSLALNPENTNGRDVLARIRGGGATAAQ